MNYEKGCSSDDWIIYKAAADRLLNAMKRRSFAEEIEKGKTFKELNKAAKNNEIIWRD